MKSIQSIDDCKSSILSSRTHSQIIEHDRIVKRFSFFELTSIVMGDENENDENYENYENDKNDENDENTKDNDRKINVILTETSNM